MTDTPCRTIDCDQALPQGIAAYLRIEGRECAFIETYTSNALPQFLAALKEAGRSPGDVRWVVVTHAHLDHAAGASALMRACPSATLLAHPRAARHLVEPRKLIAGATEVYGAERFAAMYGVVEPIDGTRVRALADGESFSLGNDTFTVHHTAGHANHHLVVHDTARDEVFTGDSYGLVYPALQTHGRFAIATTSPTGFDAAEAQLSLQKIKALSPKSVALTHFGRFEDVVEIGDQVRVWVDRAQAWVDSAANSFKTVDEVTRDLMAQWREAIEAESARRGLQFGEGAYRVLATDIELNAKGLAFAAMQQRDEKAAEVAAVVSTSRT